jgi:basic membrane protein A
VTRRQLTFLLAAVLAVVVTAAGCGGDGEGSGTTTAQRPDVRVALVTDIGGLNDRGFNAIANKGLKAAEQELGVNGRVFISDAATDYVPNLSQAALQGYDLVIANGFLMADALAAVAGRFPNTNFAIIDFPWAALEGMPANTRGLVFAEQEAGYLAGVAAATASKSSTISAVGGQAVPAVVAFLAGYWAGAKATKPGIRVLSGYSQDFVDQAKCKELALNQLSQGSDVVFAAAGGCGLSALQAAKERNAWGIGVDNDQSFLGPHILTSATKKVDVAVETAIADVADDTFQGGGDTLFDLKNGGVGYGTLSPNAPADVKAKLDETAARIKSGAIQIPRS